MRNLDIILKESDCPRDLLAIAGNWETKKHESGTDTTSKTFTDKNGRNYVVIKRKKQSLCRLYRSRVACK